MSNWFYVLGAGSKNQANFTLWQGEMGHKGGGKQWGIRGDNWVRKFNWASWNGIIGLIIGVDCNFYIVARNADRWWDVIMA